MSSLPLKFSFSPLLLCLTRSALPLASGPCACSKHLFQGPGPLALYVCLVFGLFSIICSHDGACFLISLHAPFFCLFCLFLSDAKCYEVYFGCIVGIFCFL